jgi:hypothetical protein
MRAGIIRGVDLAANQINREIPRARNLGMENLALLKLG